MSPTAAVVYIPDGLDGDEALYARRGVAHIERRNYRFLGVLRDVAHVVRLAGEGAVVVFARQAHSNSLRAEGIKREFVGEDTRRLVPIVQEAPAHRADAAGQRPIGPHHGRVAPFDESPTIAILERFRHNGRVPAPRHHDGGFAERFLRERRNRS